MTKNSSSVYKYIL